MLYRWLVRGTVVLLVFGFVAVSDSCSLLSSPDQYVPFPDLECSVDSTFYDPSTGYFFVGIIITNPGDELAFDLQHSLYFHSSADNAVVYDLDAESSDIPDSVDANGATSASFVGHTLNGTPATLDYFVYFTTASLGGYRISSVEGSM